MVYYNWLPSRGGQHTARTWLHALTHTHSHAHISTVSGRSTPAPELVRLSCGIFTDECCWLLKELQNGHARWDRWRVGLKYKC